MLSPYLATKRKHISHVVGLFYPNFGKLFAVSSTENCVIKAEAKPDDRFLWLTQHRCAWILLTFLCGHSRVLVIVCILSRGLWFVFFILWLFFVKSGILLVMLASLCSRFPLYSRSSFHDEAPSLPAWMLRLRAHSPITDDIWPGRRVKVIRERAGGVAESLMYREATACLVESVVSSCSVPDVLELPEQLGNSRLYFKG